MGYMEGTASVGSTARAEKNWAKNFAGRFFCEQIESGNLGTVLAAQTLAHWVRPSEILRVDYFDVWAIVPSP